MSDGGQISLPSAPSATPGIPENFSPTSWEKFEGLDTKSPRPAIADGAYFWGDGWMPIGPSNLRILWGTGPVIFTDTSAPTYPIDWFAFGNIADIAYGIVLQGDGAIHQFNSSTGGRVQIMPPNTILSPSSIMGFSQWGSKYLIFAKDQENGYWLWDGVNVFTAGTVGPEVILDSSGENYTSPPSITLQTPGLGGGATFSAQIDNGAISKITVDNPGSGFVVGDFATLNIQGGGTDNQALPGPPAITLNSGGLSEVYVISGGAGYTARAYVVVSGATGGGASVSLSIQNGAITGAAVITPGTLYEEAPILTVVDPGIPGTPSIPGGGGGQLGCAVAFGQITAIGIVSGGTGYVDQPIVRILGDGTGATAVPEIQGGAVTAINLTNNGRGYTQAIAVIQGGNNAANATPVLMPFGISGTAVEVFEDRVWVSNGSATSTFPPLDRTLFSDPNSPVSFSNGGGVFQSTDSFLRVGYHWLKQTNGFLYLGGDSSLNYISGVQTSAPSGTAVGPPVTTFNNINVDPQFGSPWPSSVQVFSRNIVFANTVGVFVSYGGAVTKASLPLDGFYTSGPIYGSTANFSSAVAHIFGIPVYMLLLPVIDQFTGQAVNKLLMWDGKRWFTSQQDRPLTYIATQEINSVLTAWGTDGTNIFPLFAKPSTAFRKVVQSKLFSTPGYYTTKTALRLTGVVNSYAVDLPLTITIDSEKGQGTGNALVSVTPIGAGLLWFNNTGGSIGWANNTGNPILWGGAGLDVFGPHPIAQQGRMTGLTVDTMASDLALLSLNVAHQAPYTVNL